MDGASPSQSLLGAARQNNLDLLTSILSDYPELLNSAKDPVGYGVIHYCVKYSSLECLDKILDIEDLEIDSATPNGETALHIATSLHSLQSSSKAITSNFIPNTNATIGKNGMGTSESNDGNDGGDVMQEIIEFLVDAGANTSLKDKNGRRAIDGTTGAVREILEKAELLGQIGDDVVDDEESE